jgi:hypothetical protein
VNAHLLASGCVLPFAFINAVEDEQPIPRSSAEEAIRSIENERNDAILKDRYRTLERLTSDDYTFITLRGEMLTKN